MTHLCVAIFVLDEAKAKADIARAAEAGADMVELRIDQLASGADLASILRSAVIPCIVTCRPTWEGGHFDGDEQDRLAKLMSAAEAGASYVDVELRSAQSAEVAGMLNTVLDATPRANRPGLIVSSHDFKRRPDRLYNILSDLNAARGDVNKIVWMARTIRDNLEALEILKTRQKPTIALCMGEAGLISRVLAKKFGAFLTFASLDGSAGTASGQVAVGEMKRLYRWDAINPNTKVYGVVAKPVMHSMSPAIHNAAFDATGHDGVYLPLLVEGGYESFKAFMETFVAFEGLDLAGLSVTLPHKENALRYLKSVGAEVEELAETIGAVNTIAIDRSRVGEIPKSPSPCPLPGSTGRGEEEKRGGVVLRGINTDYAAILDSITAALGISREELAGRKVAVLGAGGTGRTAVAGLAHYGADVVIYNRTKERADELAREFDGRKGSVTAAPLESILGSDCQIYINTTSVGMHPKVDECPIAAVPAAWSSSTVVFDTIYNPMKTKLLQMAERTGAKTISGVEMFVRQAVAQFELWTGRKAPVEVMRRVVEGRLGS